MTDEAYTFVVADDEPEIREGFRDRVPWAELGFRFAGACADGREALELAEREAPDVLMTDINMPFLDGLSLCERVAEVSPSTKVLILTGYDDFDYARKALKLQVVDFILKPVTPAEFRAVLGSLKARLDAERRAVGDLERLRSQLEESLPLLRERFLNRLAAGGPDGGDAAERAARLGVPFDPAADYGCAIALDFDRRSRGEQDDLAVLAVRRAAEEAFPACVRRASFQGPDEKVAVLCWGSDGPLLYRECLKAALAARSRLAKAGFAGAAAGVGEAARGLEGTASAYREAARALAAGRLRGGGRVVAYRELVGDASRAEEAPSIRGRAIAAALKAASEAEARKAVDDLADSFRTCPSPAACRLAAGMALAFVVRTLEELEVPAADVFSGDADPFSEAAALADPEAVREWFGAVCGRVLLCLASRQENFARSKAREALDFIEARYADPEISLTVLCKELGISASYFSAVFKKYRERTFVEELTETRMRRAMELLRTTNAKTAEIASAVGYRDPHYFSLCFRKFSGATPSGYREGASGG